MIKRLIFLLLIIAFSYSNAQSITGEQLLEKAISYHDPGNTWTSFNDTLMVRMETPKQSDRNSTIVINLPGDYFYVKAVRDENATEFTVNKGQCGVRFNGSSEFDAETANEHRLGCDRADLYKNYYTYLYGLPMKLRDPGTIISPQVERREFKGKDYLVLQVGYDRAIGTDAWMFYFDPETYAMEVYQFFRTEENGEPKPDTGEYILLSGEETVGGIKMPKVRAWYYNKDDGYLGTDHLEPNR